MPITHTNRTGRTYYLHTGPKRGSGVPYYFSMEAKGSLAEAVPPGFEIYESMQGQVFLRREQPKLICDDEKASLEREIEKLQSKKLYKLELRGKSITIFESENGFDRLADSAPFLSQPAATRALQERLASYQAVMRFILTDREHRLFTPERFCFRGSVDEWISMGPSEPLEKLASTYVKHLGRDSFYELY